MKSGRFYRRRYHGFQNRLSDSIRSVGDSLTAIENWYLSHIFDAKPASPEQFIESIHAVTREDIVKAAGQLQLDTIYLLKGNGGDANE